MEVRPPRCRSENPCTVDGAQKRRKQESMAKARTGKVPIGHRGRGCLHAEWPGLIPRGLVLKRLLPARYALHPGAWLRTAAVIDRRAPLVLQLVATRDASLYLLRGTLV